MITAPNGYFCFKTKQIMAVPYLGECGHLFDRSVLQLGHTCPQDNMPLDLEHCVSVPLLASKIEAWRKRDRAPVALLPKQIKPVACIRNAHRDDIHGLMKITSKIFVSGSKDTTLTMWEEGQKGRPLESSHQKRGYQSWITALAKINENKFVSGTRDGYLSVWNLDGVEQTSFAYMPSGKVREETKAKDRNKGRINCVSANPFNNSETFFTGTPKFIQLWNCQTGKMIRHWIADPNDWVYCIEPLSQDAFLTVIGSRLERWTHIYDKVDRKSLLLEEDTGTHTRPHISSIVRLEANRNLLPCALFDGSVRVVDIATDQVAQVYREHQNRVWSVIELAPNLIASSADDRLIKIWDLRQKQSQLSLDGNPGRVSCLLKLDENEFISASCPDKVFESKEKAMISFWDLRMITPHLTGTDL